MSRVNLTDLLEQARSGALDRRTFVQRALAAGIGANAAGAMFGAAAAQTASPEASPETSPSASPAASPAVDHGAMTKSITREEDLARLQDHFSFEKPAKTGGQAIYVSTVDMKTLNPVIRADVAALFVIGNVFNSLVNISAIDGSNVPDLADYWEVSEDGLRYVFHINENAAWHDGQPVTADDVVFTFDAIVDPSGLCPVQSDFIQVVDSYRAIDTHTVEMIAKLPTAVFLNKSAALVGIMPKHIWESTPITEWPSAPGSTGTDPSKVVGSGPFKFTEWVQGDHATIAKNETYWLPDLVPVLDTYTLHVVADATSAIQTLTTGESDIADLPAPQIDAFKKGNPDMTVDVYDTFRWSFFIPNQDEKNAQFFKEKDVRQALMYALDREAIVTNLLDGYAVVAEGTQPVISRAYAPDSLTTHYTYDVDKAKSLLEAAGWVDSDGDGIREKDGVKMSMEFPYNSSDPTNDTLVPYLQQAWKAVGLDIQPSGMPQSNLIDRVFANDFQLSLLGITWTEEDQGTFFRTGVGFNLSHYSNPEYDKLNDEQLVELDDKKRMELLIQQTDILNEDVALGIMYFNKAATASNPRIHNLRPNAYGSTWSISYVWAEDA
ncbi:MAG: ABC transporter substrate-binding protein [Thermomicrobiales bacterium]